MGGARSRRETRVWPSSDRATSAPICSTNCSARSGWNRVGWSGIDPESEGLARARKLGPRDHPRGRRLAARAVREARHGLRGDQRLRAPRRGAEIRGRRYSGDRPDAGRGRPGGDPACQPARAPRRTERQHDHLRRAGDHPDRLRRESRRRGALRRDRRVGVVVVGRAGHPGQHRRVHQDHVARRADHRRRETRQGDHHPQPGRSANDHARHHLLRHPRRRRPRRDRPVDSRRRRRSADLRAGLPAAQRPAVRRPVGALRRPGAGHHLRRGRRRRRLPAAVCGQPRHHDRRGHQGGRGDRQGIASRRQPREHRHEYQTSSSTRSGTSG